MMNAPGMTPAQFEEQLAIAVTGGIQSDTGASADVDAALLAIAQTAPDVPATLISRARNAYAAQTLPAG